MLNYFLEVEYVICNAIENFKFVSYVKKNFLIYIIVFFLIYFKRKKLLMILFSKIVMMYMQIVFKWYC